MAWTRTYDEAEPQQGEDGDRHEPMQAHGDPIIAVPRAHAGSA